MKRILTAFVLVLGLLLNSCQALPSDGIELSGNAQIPEGAVAIDFAGSGGEVVDKIESGELPEFACIAITSADGADRFLKKYNYDLSATGDNFFENNFVLMYTFVMYNSNYLSTEKTVKSCDENEVVLETVNTWYKQAWFNTIPDTNMVPNCFIEVPVKYSGQYVTQTETAIFIDVPEERLEEYKKLGKGCITARESVDLSNIAIDVQEQEYADGGKLEAVRSYTVYTDAAGNYSFEPKTAMVWGRIRIESLPEGYGIIGGANGLPVTDSAELNLVELDKVCSVRVDEKISFYASPQVTLYNEEGALLTADIQICDQKYAEDFVRSILVGNNSYITMTVKCGDFSREFTVELDCEADEMSAAERTEKLKEMGFAVGE